MHTLYSYYNQIRTLSHYTLYYYLQLATFLFFPFLLGLGHVGCWHDKILDFDSIWSQIID